MSGSDNGLVGFGYDFNVWNLWIGCRAVGLGASCGSFRQTYLNPCTYLSYP